jgi:hypothetical protein
VLPQQHRPPHDVLGRQPGGVAVLDQVQQAGPQTLARLVAEAFLGLAVGPIAGAG